MADKRMFSKSFVDSDLFLDMPQTAQLLYFHLSMRADDDGFINNPKSIARNVKCGEDDLKILAAKGFIIPFESGIIVIAHWKLHNYIKSDRYKETVYLAEKAQLQIENNQYILSGAITEPECLQSGAETEPQNRDRESTEINQNSKNNMRKHEAEELFERIWKLYQNKKGKNQVSESAKIRLLDVGYEELTRAIDRYECELKKDADWRKRQNGSTFFNSGYVDYLDKNYQAGGEQDGAESASSINLWQQ